MASATAKAAAKAKTTAKANTKATGKTARLARAGPKLVAEEVWAGGRTGWRVAIPGGRPLATPAVGGGKVFLGGGYGSRDLYAFDAATGALAWHLATKDDGPTAAVVVEGRVAFNTESCTIYVVDADTGRIVWERWLGDPLMAQPAADRERVYMVYPKGGKHVLAAFVLETGAPAWEAPIGHDAITAPVVHEGRVYASAYDGKVHAFAAATGERLWSRRLRATSAPWIAGDRLFVSTRQDARGGKAHEAVQPFEAATGERARGSAGASYARRVGAPYLESKRGSAEARDLDLQDAAVGFAQAPAAAKLGAVEALTGEYRVAGSWRYQGSRPVAAGGRLFSIAGDALTAADLATGSTAWARASDQAIRDVRNLAPPAAANGKLFVASRAGQVACLRQADGEPLWTGTLGHPCEWSPAVAGGRVYVGTRDGRLVCLETGDPADDGWPMWGGGPGHNG